MKRVAVIQDISGLGRCSLAAALPVLSVMGLQACPVPTAVYTNQTGYSRFAALDCAPLLGEFPAMWAAHGVQLDGIYTGFMSSKEQLAAAQAIIDRFRTPETLVLVDPVMGDQGSRYPGFDDETCRAIAEFAGQADVITPNVTEACILAGVDYCEFLSHDEAAQRELLKNICELLPQQQVVVTGWHCGEEICNAAWDKGVFTVYASPALGGSWSGTGDLFAAALCGGLVLGDFLDVTIRRALSFLEASLRDAAALRVPPEDGIPFENHLLFLKKK